MDHLARNVQSGFARDEEDASPFALRHRARIVTRESNARKHVDLEVAQPLGVRDIEERHAGIDAEVIDEDVDLGDAREHGLRAFGARAVRSDTLRDNLRQVLAQAPEGGVDRGLRAPGDRDVRAFSGKPSCNRIADASGRAGDQRLSSFESKVHGCTPL